MLISGKALIKQANMSSDNPPQPVQELGPISAPMPAVAQPPQIACPNCSTIVKQGDAYCPNCGSPIPPTYPGIPAAPPPRKPRKALIVGILLIFLIFVGSLSFVVYMNFQHQNQILQAAKTAEQADANQAPDQIRFTCLSVTPDRSNLQYNATSHIYSGYALVSEEIGITNPTRFTIDATWKMTIDFTAVNIITTASTSFHLASDLGAKPIFPFRITGAQYNNLPQSPDFSKYTTTLTATYAVTGTYGTYHFTEHSSYDSTTGTGTGILTSSTNIVSC